MLKITREIGRLELLDDETGSGLEVEPALDSDGAMVSIYSSGGPWYDAHDLVRIGTVLTEIGRRMVAGECPADAIAAVRADEEVGG